MRIFLHSVDFSKNVESSETGWADLSIQWQLHPGWKTMASPPPLKKVRLYQEKMGKDLPRKKVERQGNAEMTGSTTTGKHTEDIDPNKSPPFFLSLKINFLSCQSESSGLFSVIWVTIQEACCPFFILMATEDKPSQRKELKKAFQTNVGCIEGFLLYTSSNALEQLAKQFFNN